jgi:biofilm PGA synthesis lipoprotein PgaB
MSRAPTILVAAALGMLLWLVGAARAVEAQPGFIALCYHNLEDADPDQTYIGVTTVKFVEQLSWLRRNGYTFVSVDDLLAARAGKKALPEKAVLLTFDDGYESFYTRAFPILKAFNAPAVLGLVGAWMAGASGHTVAFGQESAPRELFMTWDQVREVAASGLVEIASHTYDLHKGVLANPQGNVEPAAVTLTYGENGYENEDAYRHRIDADTDAMAQTIARETGKRPRVTVWPYGAYNGLAVAVGAAHGMGVTFSLDEGPADISALAALPRHYLTNDPSLGNFIGELRDLPKTPPVRVVQIDLDYVYDPNPAQQAHNLDAIVQRIHDLDINTVYLQAFADPDGTGLTRAVYFPNRLLPMRADLFNRVAWQLRTRARVAVYAWMPVLAFDFGGGAELQHVTAWNPASGTPAMDRGNYTRLSPFDLAARLRIRELYEDLARNAMIDGLLFHDDALLSDFEDASPAALAAYARAGFPLDIAAIRADPALLERWTRFKTAALIDFTHELAAAAQQYRDPLRTARNMYARPLLEPASTTWYAQDYDRFLEAYDYVALMAMPELEGSAADEDWLRQLVARAAASSDGLKRTVFELQSVDWRHKEAGSDRPITSETLAGEMNLLARLGVRNFGYYPDDFLKDQPRLGIIAPAFSLRTHPYPLP